MQAAPIAPKPLLTVLQKPKHPASTQNLRQPTTPPTQTSKAVPPPLNPQGWASPLPGPPAVPFNSPGPTGIDLSCLDFTKAVAKLDLDNGDYDEVISNVRCLLEGHWFSTDRELLLMRGQALAAKGEQAAACRDFAKCLQHHSNDAEALQGWLASAAALEATRLTNPV